MLLGLTGKKRAGKDSVAEVLVRAHGFQRVAFADPLRQACLGLDPLVAIHSDELGPLAQEGFRLSYGVGTRYVRLSDLVTDVGWEVAKGVREVRRTLQNYGVAIRAIQPEFWIDAALAQALPVLDNGGRVVITDVRFPNELDAIALYGGHHWHVDRPGNRSDDTHPSEVALEPFYDQADTWVENAGTLDDLEVAVHSFLRSLEKRAA